MAVAVIAVVLVFVLVRLIRVEAALRQLTDAPGNQRVNTVRQDGGGTRW